MSETFWNCFLDMGKLRKFVEDNQQLPDSMPVFLEQDGLIRYTEADEGHKYLNFEPGDTDNSTFYTRAWDIHVHHEDKDIIVLNVNY